jgi:NAD(P)-dependent dehydrogenase (short-subunit alcohol dehydrogenase family)
MWLRSSRWNAPEARSDAMAAKIRAAVAAKRDPDFFIIARTDSRAVLGFEEAVRRANAALAVGADMAFVEAPQTVEEVAAVPRLVKGPCLLNVVWRGKTPEVAFSEAERMGYRFAIVPGMLFKAVIGVCDAVLSELHNTGRHPVPMHSMTVREAFRRVGADEWDAVMAINLKPAFRLAKGVLRGMMKARHGRIIQIGSVVGASGNPGQTNYAAAKAALVGFTKSLAQEVGSRNITINCVAPGFVDTDMTKALPEAQRAALLEKIPLGRLGSPEDIAHAVLFLASPQAGYITGATLHVNGGMYMA